MDVIPPPPAPGGVRFECACPGRDDDDPDAAVVDADPRDVAAAVAHVPVLRELLSDIDPDAGAVTVPLSLLGITADAMRRVLRFAGGAVAAGADDPPTAPPCPLPRAVPFAHLVAPWLHDAVAAPSTPLLADLAHAAHALGMPVLYRLACGALGDRLRGDTAAAPPARCPLTVVTGIVAHAPEMGARLGDDLEVAAAPLRDPPPWCILGAVERGVGAPFLRAQIDSAVARLIDDVPLDVDVHLWLYTLVHEVCTDTNPNRPQDAVTGAEVHDVACRALRMLADALGDSPERYARASYQLCSWFAYIERYHVPQSTATPLPAYAQHAWGHLGRTTLPAKTAADPFSGWLRGDHPLCDTPDATVTSGDLVVYFPAGGHAAFTVPAAVCQRWGPVRRTLFVAHQRPRAVALWMPIGHVMPYVIDFGSYHAHKPMDPIAKPLVGPLRDAVCAFDRALLYTDLIRNGDERHHDLLVDVISAANGLEEIDLLDLSCAAVASMIRDKSPEEIRTLFRIDDP